MAKAADAADVASTHDEGSRRAAYQGIIPGAELEKTDQLAAARNGEQDSAIRKGMPRQRAGVRPETRSAGYACYGRFNRARSLHFQKARSTSCTCARIPGPPESFGRRLFTSAKRDLVQSGLKSMVIWALSDNDTATEFYRALGGRMVARSSERFGAKSLDKVAFAWTN